MAARPCWRFRGKRAPLDRAAREARSSPLWLAWLASFASLAAVACTPSPSDVALPTELASFDPALRALIEAKAEAARAAPDDARAVASLGLVYEAQRQWEEARACFEAAHRLEPAEARWVQHAALCLHYGGRSEEALAFLRTREAALAGDAPALHLYGSLLACAGEPEAAARAYEGCVANAPDRPEGYVGLAEVQLQLGDSRRAATLLGRALEIDGSWAPAHYLLGLAYRDLGRHDEAREHLARGAGASVRQMPDPLSEELLSYLVTRVDRLANPGQGPGGRREAAKRNAAAVLEHDPSDPRALVVLGSALLKDGRFAAALETFDRALAADPEDVPALVHRGRALAELGQPAAAAQSLRRALELDPGFAPALTSLASVLLAAGEPEEAAAAAERALALDPGSADAHATLALVHLKSGRADLARTGFARALELKPRNPRLLEAYGHACSAAGDPEGAYVAFRRLTERAPGDAPGYVHLARAALALGRSDEAREHLETARRLGASGALLESTRESLRKEAVQAEGPGLRVGDPR